MSRFPDTSFLFSLYLEQVHSHKADAFMDSHSGSLMVSNLLLFEFRQSIRFQTWLHRQDRTRGFRTEAGTLMLRHVQEDLRARTLVVSPVDWADVHCLAESLSARHTPGKGHRFADILHVATALHLGTDQFLTFDNNQRKLAEAEGLKIPL